MSVKLTEISKFVAQALVDYINYTRSKAKKDTEVTVNDLTRCKEGYVAYAIVVDNICYVCNWEKKRVTFDISDAYNKAYIFVNAEIDREELTGITKLPEIVAVARSGMYINNSVLFTKFYNNAVADGFMYNKLDSVEKAKILKQYGTNIPKMLASDIIALSHGFEVGDVIMVMVMRPLESQYVIEYRLISEPRHTMSVLPFGREKLDIIEDEDRDVIGYVEDEVEDDIEDDEDLDEDEEIDA